MADPDKTALSLQIGNVVKPKKWWQDARYPHKYINAQLTQEPDVESSETSSQNDSNAASSRNSEIHARVSERQSTDTTLHESKTASGDNTAHKAAMETTFHRKSLDSELSWTSSEDESATATVPTSPHPSLEPWMFELPRRLATPPPPAYVNPTCGPLPPSWCFHNHEHVSSDFPTFTVQSAVQAATGWTPIARKRTTVKIKGDFLWDASIRPRGGDGGIFPAFQYPEYPLPCEQTMRAFKNFETITLREALEAVLEDLEGRQEELKIHATRVKDKDLLGVYEMREMRDRIEGLTVCWGALQEVVRADIFNMEQVAEAELMESESQRMFTRDVLKALNMCERNIREVADAMRALEYDIWEARGVLKRKTEDGNVRQLYWDVVVDMVVMWIGMMRDYMSPSSG